MSDELERDRTPPRDPYLAAALFRLLCLSFSPGLFGADAGAALLALPEPTGRGMINFALQLLDGLSDPQVL